MSPQRQPRADAQRNRARVLRAAIDTFAERGLSVPVQEIARRAGVSTGTVSRHFPTKEELYEAIVIERVGQIVQEARRLAQTREPGDAFFAFFGRMVEEGATDRGLAEALAGAGFDMEAAARRAGYDVTGTWRDLLGGAQQAGAVRPDVDVADVKALLAGCLARARDGTLPVQTVAVITDGLRSSPCRPPA